jgi:two-component system, cell cycle sensor histidine kinase and response regulator CckA
LNSVITNLQKMLKVLVGERYDLSFVPGTKLDRVLADPGQVEQVVINLVANARDAMPEGGPIEIRTENLSLDQTLALQQGVPVGQYVRLSVKDSGCGMDAETQSRIFQPFFTTKEVGKGTGLGLSIVYNAIKQSGGFVEVKSAPGRGSAFHIAFPKLETPVSSSARKPAQAEVLRGSGTILVVEDEEGVRNIIRDTLRSRGYEVLIANNGEEALRLLQEHAGNIPLVLADVVMPKVGGLDLALKLHASPLGPKVLLMSGYTDLINEIENAKLPLLRKPFTADELVFSLRTLLEGDPKAFQAVPV